MKNVASTLLLLLVITIMSSACEEYAEWFPPKGHPRDSVKVDSTALLTWTGEYEVDGCGFFITIDSVQYKPNNEDSIDDRFKDSSSPGGFAVIIEYKPLEIEKAFHCGDAPEPQIYPWIEVLSLQRK